ncbi:MAG TPA: phosphoribosyltransferase, partial [Pseudomonas sp.]|nr:phosphoribosyltransferase [Pseudomonas sp.]
HAPRWRARHYDREPPKGDIRLRGKRVLVVDDICTNGRSLDAARAYIEAAGGTAVLFSWLKTISRGYLHMSPAPALNPFQPNVIVSEPWSSEFRYGAQILSHDAPAEIDRTLEGVVRNRPFLGYTGDRKPSAFEARFRLRSWLVGRRSASPDQARCG